MKNTTKTMLLGGLLLAGMVTGCKKDKDPVAVPQPVINEPEVITTMQLILVDSSDASNIRYATYRDPDGDGGAGYDIFDTIKLQPNKTWQVGVFLLNETTTPIDTITNEVFEERNDHRFCYTPSGTSATVTITDRDDNYLPIGIISLWKTTVPGNGTMQIQLRHQPGIKDGTCTPGETDVDVTFQVRVQ